MHNIQILLVAEKLLTSQQLVFRSLVIVKGISITVMALVLFFSYNRKHMKFVRIFDALETIDGNLKQTSNNINATRKMVVTFIVVTALASYSAVNTFMISKTSNLRQDHLYSAILHVCMVSMFYGQCVFLVHFSHITQSIASRFTRVTFKMERVVIRNHFRSLIPYQILNSVSGSGGATSSTEGIPALIRDYWLLCDTVREANAFYGDQLLAVVLTTFIRAVIHLSAFVVIYNSVLIGSIYAGIWSLVHILFLLTLAYLCTIVTESADEMTHSVLKLINMDIDEELRDQMAGAITTYLVILVQFQTSS
ncbi:hypothetical protein J6590_073402 [Homalodisca vitripennis]|nr:hypothetical protein J6590_073402 [Homalodisca vitripennis]